MSLTGHEGRLAKLARGPMGRLAYILAHAATAGVFMYFLQTLALQATPESSLPVAIVFALAAAGLAWYQSNR